MSATPHLTIQEVKLAQDLAVRRFNQGGVLDLVFREGPHDVGERLAVVPDQVGKLFGSDLGPWFKNWGDCIFLRAQWPYTEFNCSGRTVMLQQLLMDCFFLIDSQNRGPIA